jgi:hypothetical protein
LGPALKEKHMIIVDALLTIFDFFRALVLADQIPQDNWQANVYNFFAALGNFFSLISGSIFG